MVPELSSRWFVGTRWFYSLNSQNESNHWVAYFTNCDIVTIISPEYDDDDPHDDLAIFSVGTELSSRWFAETHWFNSINSPKRGDILSPFNHKLPWYFNYNPEYDGDDDDDDDIDDIGWYPDSIHSIYKKE